MQNDVLNNNDISAITKGGILVLIGWILNVFLKEDAASLKKYIRNIQQTIFDKKDNQRNEEICQLKQYQNRGKQIKTFFQLNASSIKVNKQTLKINKREVQLKHKNPIYFENCTGGYFTFQHKKDKVKVNIDSTRIFSDVLTKSQSDIRKFGHMKSIAKRLQLTLNRSGTIAAIGVLSYDFETKQFMFKPFVIGQSLQSILQQNKIDSILPYIYSFISIGFVISGIYLMREPIKRLCKKAIDFIRNIHKNQNKEEIFPVNQSYYKQTVQIKTKSNDVYVCIQCQKNTTQIVYHCGHLAFCQECHEKNGQKDKIMKCPVCRKESVDFLKIFFV